MQEPCNFFTIPKPSRAQREGIRVYKPPNGKLLGKLGSHRAVRLLALGRRSNHPYPILFTGLQVSMRKTAGARGGAGPHRGFSGQRICYLVNKTLCTHQAVSLYNK